MTTYEHAMLGATVAVALGFHRGGWGPVVVAAVAGALPDWDGLTIVFGGEIYARSHRVWGHNLLAAGIVGLLVGSVGLVWKMSLRTDPLLGPRAPFRFSTLLVWLLAALLGALIHLPADMIFSGHPDMTPWPVKLLWPFADQGWVVPLVAWGDVTASLLFVAAMFAVYRWPARAQSIAWLTLIALHAYIGLRWHLGGVGPRS